MKPNNTVTRINKNGFLELYIAMKLYSKHLL